MLDKAVKKQMLLLEFNKLNILFWNLKTFLRRRYYANAN